MMLAEVLIKVLKKYWWKYWQYFSNEISASLLAILSKNTVNNPVIFISKALK